MQAHHTQAYRTQANPIQRYRVWACFWWMLCLHMLTMHQGWGVAASEAVRVDLEVISDTHANVILHIAPEWHVGGPGDAFSKPPRVTGPAGCKLSVDLPKPHWKTEAGLKLAVYEGRVVIPVQCQDPWPAGEPLVMHVVACSKDGCYPLTVELTWPHAGKRTGGNQATSEPLSWWQWGGLLLAAFLGGLFLNVMPCVLPVLGVKLMLFARKEGGGQGALTVRNLWATVAGIVFAFMVLALAALVLRSIGGFVGWGVHFQNPYFLSVMMALMVLFTANALECFDLSVPAFLQRASGRLMQRDRIDDGHTSSLWPVARSFFTGMLGVALATPCTAPFVGTALGMALAQPAGTIASVFLSIALGFAAPYWMMALLPSHRLRLPKPGPWLVWMRRFMGLLLLGTLVWLGSLLSVTYGAAHAVALTVLIGSCFGAFYLWERGVHGAFWAGFLLLGVVALWPLERSWLGFHVQKLPATNTGFWKPFQPATISQHINQGRVVLVDVTAIWCVTCQVNKRFVLHVPRVQRYLKERGVVCMQADWSHPDRTIEAFLTTFKRTGIPLNVVFGPKAPQGLVLPPLLTESALQQAVQTALGRQESTHE